MKDNQHSRDASVAGENQPVTTERGQRRAYAAPALKRHAKLPVITAGSISEEMWQFETGDQS